MRLKWFLIQVGISLVSILLIRYYRRNIEYIDIPQDNESIKIKRLKLKISELEEENRSFFYFGNQSNCENCGAGLNSRVCEYCNTKY